MAGLQLAAYQLSISSAPRSQRALPAASGRGHTPVCGQRARDAKSRRRGVLSLFAAGVLCGLADQSVTERPPSTASTWPLTYAPALDARNTTAPPSSSGLAQRPSGVRCSTQAVKL